MKKFVLALIVSLCLILPLSVSASELEKSFETNFDLADSLGYIYSMTSYDDSGNVDGYIIHSNNMEIYRKYDLNNKLVWNKSNIVVKDLNVTINNSNLLIKRINPDTSEVIWQDKFGGNGSELVNGIFYDYDSKDNVTGYLLIVNTDSTDLDINPGTYIIKYSLNGKMLWIKPCQNTSYVSEEFMKNKDGDCIEFSTYHGEHGIVQFGIFNKTKNNEILIKYYGMSSETRLIVHDDYVIFVLYENGDNGYFTRMFKYNCDGEVLFEKKLKIPINPFMLINSKTIDGDLDGFISINYSEMTKEITKFDYDGNLVWEKELSYAPYFISESYDETGEFNGYIVTGYDSANKKEYITKFTYPKKTIKSKSSDVEVIIDAYPGKTVTVKVKEKTGYVVKRIVVKDSSGEEIEVSDDGTFVMPDDDVSIEVIYEKKAENIITNPKTSSALCVALAIISISLLGTFIVKNKKVRGENL